MSTLSTYVLEDVPSAVRLTLACRHPVMPFNLAVRCALESCE